MEDEGSTRNGVRYRFEILVWPIIDDFGLAIQHPRHHRNLSRRQTLIFVCLARNNVLTAFRAFPPLCQLDPTEMSYNHKSRMANVEEQNCIRPILAFLSTSC